MIRSYLVQAVGREEMRKSSAVPRVASSKWTSPHCSLPLPPSGSFRCSRVDCADVYWGCRLCVFAPLQQPRLIPTPPSLPCQLIIAPRYRLHQKVTRKKRERGKSNCGECRSLRLSKSAWMHLVWKENECVFSSFLLFSNFWENTWTNSWFSSLFIIILLRGHDPSGLLQRDIISS